MSSMILVRKEKVRAFFRLSLTKNTRTRHAPENSMFGPACMKVQ
jgi:hypothetical protein